MGATTHEGRSYDSRPQGAQRCVPPQGSPLPAQCWSDHRPAARL